MRLLSWKSSCSVLALTAGWLIALPAFAQQPVAIELPTVEVTGAKQRPAKATDASGIASDEVVVSPTTVPTKSEQIASSVTVITAEELQRTQQRTVADALRTVPGLNVVQTGGPGGLTSVFMRGMNANHTKVFIDGIDVSDASTPTGGVDLAHLMTDDIERIEVLRGPQSGLYGSDAMGGVISIITKQGKGPPKLTGMMEGGSFGTFNQSVGASGSDGTFNYAFNIGHRRVASTPVTPLELLAPGERRNNDFYENWTYTAKMGVDVSKSLSLNMVTRYTDARLKFTEDDFSNFPLVFPFDTRSDSEATQLFMRGEAVVTLLDGAFKNYFGISHTDQRRKAVSPDPFSPTGFSTTRYAGELIKYDWRGVATVAPGQVLVMGLENQTETVRAIAFSTVTGDENNSAGYVELQSQLAKRAFLVANVRHDENEFFGGHTTWRLAPTYILPGTETKLKASVGTGFKSPTLYQRFGTTIINPGLQPEESFGYDFGFEQPLANDKVRFGVTYFHNDITNLIQGLANTNVNIGRATTSGYEVFASAVLTRSLTGHIDYTYTEATNDITGAELLRRPKHKAGVTATWTPLEALSLSATALWVGERADVDRFFGNPVTASPYTLVNLAADYKLNEQVTLFGRVDNLFDERYQDPTGFERPGLGVFAGLRLTNR